jgi:molecular chaperone DnaK (HSP70)
MNNLPDLEEPTYRYIAGIDLGTTNSAVAFVDRTKPLEDRRRIRFMDILQLVSPGEMSRLPVLPSFLYIPGRYELPPESTGLPWNSDRDYAAGEFAREQGALVPGRLVSSAKSWLCHAGVDRTANILPWGAGTDVKKLSPVEASARYLLHMKEVWNESIARRREGYRLEEQLLILTVPASFDEVARELTVEAARDAGLTRVVLVEEPLAAFYAWLSKRESDWQQMMKPGQLILVCDVGGGTTDFTIVAVREGEKGLRFDRLAVGDHLMLGGDNMDLALARHIEMQLMGQPGKLDSKRWHQLWHQCRKAKESLLGDTAASGSSGRDGSPGANSRDHVDITIVGSGGKLIAGTLKGKLARSQVEELILEGFFPFVSENEQPAGGRRAGLTEWGLPYVQDPAITRHMAAFWQRFRGLLQSETGRSVVYPDFVLFNGGALTPRSVRHRILQVVHGWFKDQAGEDWAPVELENPRPELAVAIGAAYYGLVRLGEGVRVGAGSPRSYYVEVAGGDEKAEPGEGSPATPRIEEQPLHTVVCLVPRGTEEGFQAQLDQLSFSVLTNQPVAFQLFSSSTRLGDKLGEVSDVPEGEITALPPIRTVLRYGKKGSAQSLPVQLAIRLTEVGTLELWCQSQSSPHRWQLQFDVRDQGEAREARRSSIGGETLDSGLIEQACDKISAVFQSAPPRQPPEKLTKDLVAILDLGREKWPTPLIRKLADALIEAGKGRALGPQHEARWLNLLGFCLRPGFGDPLDEWRMKEVWKIYPGGLAFHRHAQSRSEWWIFWRRLAGGLTAGQQWHIYQQVVNQLIHGDKKKKSAAKMAKALSPQEEIEVWMALANFERLPADAKVELGVHLLERIRRGKPRPQELWALSRLGERVPLYGPLDQVAPGKKVALWVDDLLTLSPQPNEAFARAVLQLARLTGDRERDLPPEVRDRLSSWLDLLPGSERFKQLLTQPETILMDQEEDWIFGEALPAGLVLAP